MSRDLWFERAARYALSPIAQVQDPELKQDVVACEHSNARPARTEFHGQRRQRIYACLDCGEEFTK